MESTLAITKPANFNELVSMVEKAKSQTFDLHTSLDDISILGDGRIFDRRNERFLGFTDTGIGQFSRKLGIPAPYTTKLLTAGQAERWADHANYWAHTQTDDLDPYRDILVRGVTIEGVDYVRAVLTSKYGILDNDEITYTVAQAFDKLGLTDQLTIEDVWMTPSKFHVRMTARKAALDAAKAAGHKGLIKEGHDFLFPTLEYGNSEIGTGSATMEGGVWRAICTNGLVSPFGSVNQYRKRHFGFTIEDLNDFIIEKAEEILKNATSFTKVFAESQAAPMDEPVTTLQNLFARKRVSKRDERAVLAELADASGIDSNDKAFSLDDLNATSISVYDAINAITATARDRGPEERLTLERLAAELLK